MDGDTDTDSEKDHDSGQDSSTDTDTYQPSCGDGILNPGELCDDGNVESGDGCTANCKQVEEGYVCPTAGEPCLYIVVCGDGINISQYGGCAPGCVDGPYCGDRIVQSGYEICDDGVNDGSYVTCDEGCVLAPYCGDGIVQEEAGEECDDGNRVNNDGCIVACKKSVVVI